VIELVDRFEAEDERGIAVIFERDGREQRRLEAVRGAVADDAAKAAQRGPSAWLVVVRQLVQIPLNGERRTELRQQPSLALGKGEGSYFSACRSAISSSGFQSLPV
jgi:hypothetical protein